MKLFSKEIERACVRSIASCEIDLVDMLLSSQSHNALQLERFLLHFISTNYGPLKATAGFSRIEGESLAFIEEHQVCATST